MKLRFDAEKCVGHGRCYVLGPEVYGEDEAGHCIPRTTDIPPELQDQARAGEQNCPEGALEVDEN